VGFAKIWAKYPSVMYSRLKILHNQGYIAKNYDKSYRLKGKPASYYLLPKALKLLKGRRGIDERLLIYMRRDNKRTKGFIDHHIAVLDSYVKLKQLYINDTRDRVFTKNELAAYSYFPTPRSDLYLYIEQNGQTTDFILEYIEETKPWFVIKQIIAKYIDHVENGDWDETKTPYPAILLICDTHHLQKRLIKHITNSLEQIWIDDLHFALTTHDSLMTSTSKSDKIWLPVNYEVGKLTSLGGLSRSHEDK